MKKTNKVEIPIDVYQQLVRDVARLEVLIEMIKSGKVAVDDTAKMLLEIE